MAKEKSNFGTVISKIKNKEYSPIYLLYGEEAFFIDEISKLCVNSIIPEEEQSFNLAVLYGKDCTMRDIIANAKTFPFIGEKKLIIVKEAQNLLKDLKQLESYANQYLKSTILMFCFKDTKSIDNRLKVVKIIDEIGTIFESKKLYERETASWITTQLKNKKMTISSEALQLLISHTGTDLSLINNEINKLFIAIGNKKNEISSEDISKYVGVNKEYNIFELQKAIGKKDFYTSIKIIDYFTQNRNSTNLVLLFSNLYNFFTKILILHCINYRQKSDYEISNELGVNPFFVKDYVLAASNFNIDRTINNISYLKEADLKYKGVLSRESNEDIFKELIFKILY